MTATDPGRGPVQLFRSLSILGALLLAATAQADNGDDCANRKFRPGQPLKYCGDLPSLAAVNIRNAVLDEIHAGLEKPWAMEFVSASEVLITEIEGGIKRLNIETGEAKAVSGGPVVPGGYKQVGLLDVALHPQFTDNGRVYLSHSVQGEVPPDKGYSVALSTAVLTPTGLEQLEQLYVARPYAPAPAQFGGALEFDNGGYLYFATGDRGTKGPAQDPANTIGKLLRLTDEGKLPPDNPFLDDPHIHDAVYAWGLRNPQGLRFDSFSGAMYETEHGPMGGDEINVMLPGRNYGWPTVSYGAFYNTEAMGVGTTMEGMEEPLWFYLPSIAVSPIEVYRGAMFPEWDGYLMTGALKGQHVSLLLVKGGRVLFEQAVLQEVKGRVRDIKVAADGSVFILVEDGRLLRLWRDREDPDLDQQKDRPGRRVYGYICASCHDRVGNDAPQLDDAAYWGPRLRLSPEDLYRAVNEGRGAMPARGLCENCSDNEIARAVDALLSQVRSTLEAQQ